MQGIAYSGNSSILFIRNASVQTLTTKLGTTLVEPLDTWESGIGDRRAIVFDECTR